MPSEDYPMRSLASFFGYDRVFRIEATLLALSKDRDRGLGFLS